MTMLFRPIEILTRPGSLFEPRPPAPCFMYGWRAARVTYPQIR